MGKKPPYEFNIAWENLLEDDGFIEVFLSSVLQEYIVQQRWYGGKSSKLKYIELPEHFRIQQHGEVYYGLILEINFEEAFYQHYFLPIAFVSDEKFAKKDRILPLKLNGVDGFIIDALNLEAFRKLVFQRLVTAEPNDTTKVRYHKSVHFHDTVFESSRYMGMEQSNTSIIINDKFVIKFFRRIYADKNPDYEMSLFLSEKKEYQNTPAYMGSLSIIDSDNANITIALMQSLVPNQGDAWEFMSKEIDEIFECLDRKKIRFLELPKVALFTRLGIQDVPPEIIDWAGLSIFLRLQKLAERTAEMHIALGSEFEDTAFTPEHFNGD